MIDPIIVQALAAGAIGALLAAAYLYALGWNVRLYVGQGAGWTALLVHSMRLLAIGAGFTLCARQGALPLLSSLAGFQMVRVAAVSRQSRALERKS